MMLAWDDCEGEPLHCTRCKAGRGVGAVAEGASAEGAAGLAGCWLAGRVIPTMVAIVFLLFFFSLPWNFPAVTVLMVGFVIQFVMENSFQAIVILLVTC
jgi:hypothetical protein